MGDRFQRYADRMREKGPDEYFADLEKARQLVGPLLTRRQYAKELVWMGMELHRGDRLEEALDVFDDAVACAVHSEERGTALAYQAVCRWRLDENVGAVEAATEAIALLEPLAAERPGRYGRFLLDARQALAMGYYDAGQLVKAVPALVRYVHMARAAPLELASDVSWAVAALADALNRLVVTDRVQLYAEAVEIVRQGRP
jgi:hypothetical protein